ncbi:MAG: ATP-binding protein [Acidimicrobiales bacterium]
MPHTVTLLHRTFALSSAAVTEARLAVVDALRRQGVSAELVDVVALATSELCANAVQAGKGSTFDVQAHASEDGSRVAMQVRSAGVLDDIPDRSTWKSEDPLAHRGRGLAIVDTIAETLDFDSDHEGLTVSATFGDDR